MEEEYIYKFWIEDHGETINDGEEFVSACSLKDGLDYIAEVYAEYYHDNRDGWDVTWPITFSISREGVYLGDVSVERESRPHFSASIVKKPEAKAEL